MVGSCCISIMHPSVTYAKPRSRHTMGLHSYRSLANPVQADVTDRGCELRLSYGANSEIRWHASKSPPMALASNRTACGVFHPSTALTRSRFCIAMSIRWSIAILNRHLPPLVPDLGARWIMLLESRSRSPTPRISNRSPLTNRSEVVDSFSRS